MYEVIVGNIGTVYSGDDLDDAETFYNDYVENSKQNYGRCAGEAVTLVKDGEPIKEYLGTQPNE